MDCIEIIKKNTEKRLAELEENINYLRTDKDSKEIMLKLESLNPRFIYNNCYPILQPWDTLEGAENNYCNLNQHIFDDVQIYMDYEISEYEKSSKDRLNEYLRKQGKPEVSYDKQLRMNINEKGEYCDILKFLDLKEKEEIQNIINYAKILKGFNKEVKLNGYYCIDLNENLKGFNKENLEFLIKEVPEASKLIKL
jgi:hypothetical protein